MLKRLLATLLATAIASVAWAGDFGVRWDPVPDTPDLAGYKVYYGTETGQYTNVAEAGLATEYVLTGLAECTTYYVAVKAADQAGNLSVGYSNEVSGWPRPTIQRSEPTRVERGSLLPVKLLGTNFMPGATVAFTQADGTAYTGVNIVNTTIDGCGQATVLVTVSPGAPTGRMTAQVVNPDSVYGESIGLVEIVQDTTPPGVVGKLRRMWLRLIGQ